MWQTSAYCPVACKPAVLVPWRHRSNNCLRQSPCKVAFQSRRATDTRTFYVIAPGWVKTDMGGAGAPLDIDISVRGVLNAMRARVGTRGVVFVNFRNELLPW